jgi:hypothetical protein
MHSRVAGIRKGKMYTDRSCGGANSGPTRRYATTPIGSPPLVDQQNISLKHSDDYVGIIR